MIAIAGGLLVGLETATASVGKKDGDAPTAFADTFQKAANDAGVVTRRGVKAERNSVNGRKPAAAETTPQAARVGQGGGPGSARAARKAVAAAIVPGEAEASVVGATKLVLDAGEDAAEPVSVGGGETAKVRVPVVPIAAQGVNAGDGVGVVGATASLAVGRDTSRFFAVPLAKGESEVAAAPLTVGEALQVAGAKLAGTRSEELVGVQDGAKVAPNAGTEEGAVDGAVVASSVVVKQGPVVAEKVEVIASGVTDGLGEAPVSASPTKAMGRNEVEIAPQGTVSATVTKVDAKRVQAGTEVVIATVRGALGNTVAPVTTPVAGNGVEKTAGDLPAASVSAKDVTIARVEDESAGAVAEPVVSEEASVRVAEIAKSAAATVAPVEQSEGGHGVRSAAPSSAAGHGNKVGREGLGKNSVDGASLASIPVQTASVSDLKLPVDQGTQVLSSGDARGEAVVQVQAQAPASVPAPSIAVPASTPAPVAIDGNVALGDAKTAVRVGSEAAGAAVTAGAARRGEYKAQVVGASTAGVGGGGKEREKDSGAVRGKTVIAPVQDSGTIPAVSRLESSASVAVAAVPVVASLPVAGPAIALETTSSQSPVAAVALETTLSQGSVPVNAVKTNVEGSQPAIIPSFVTKAVASADGIAKRTGAVVGVKAATVANSPHVEGLVPAEAVDKTASQAQVNGSSATALNNVVDSDAVAADAIPVAKEGQGRHVAVNGSSAVAKERKISVGDAKAAPSGVVGTPVDDGRAVAAVSPADGVSSAEKVAGAEHRSPVSGESQAPVSVAANGEGVSSLQAHGVQTVTHNVAAPVVAAPVVAGGLSSGLEMNGHMGLSTQASTGTDSLVSPMAHTTLQATPTVLEVGVPGGTHGWLKIRAEIGEGGTVQASMSAANHAGQETLRREMPGINAFLESEHVPVTVQVAHGLSGAGGSGLPDGSGLTKDTGFAAQTSLSQNTDSQQGREASPGALANGDGGEQSGSRQQQNASGIDSRGSAVRPVSTANDAEWTAPAGYGGASIANGGSWLNVMA